MRALALAITMVLSTVPVNASHAQDAEPDSAPRAARRPVITGRSMVATKFGIVA